MMLSAEQITAMMAADGPTVKCVVLRANGSIDEIPVDMTPKENAIVKLLGGQSSIVGQFPVIDAVVLKKRDIAPKDKKNSHKLPHPLHEEEHSGDLLLVRMNEEAEPQHFTKKEWTVFLKDAPFSNEAWLAYKEKHSIEDEADEDEERMDEAEKEAFLATFRRNFEEEHGRKPTEDEENEVIEALIGDGDDDEDEGEISLTKDEDDLLQSTVEKLEKKLKRRPNDEEIEAELSKTEPGAELVEKLTLMYENDDNESHEELTEEEEKTLDATIEKLTKKLKRDPEDDEVAEALSKIPGGDEIIRKVEQNGDDAEEELTEEENEILNSTIDKLKKKLKRDPDVDEVAEALSKIPGGEEIINKIGQDDDDDESEDDAIEDLTEAEDKIMSDVMARLNKKFKREPTSEEVETELMRVDGGEEIVRKFQGMQEGVDEDDEDNEDDDEDEEEDEVEELTEEEEALLLQTISKLEKSLKRDPSDDEVEEQLLKSKLGEEVVRKMRAAEDEGLTPEEDEILRIATEKVEKRLKRDATDEEVVEELIKTEEGSAVAAKIHEMFGGDDDDDDEDEEGGSDDDEEEDDVDLNEEEQKIVQATVNEMSRKLKRPVKEEELVAALAKKAGGLEILGKMGLLDGDDEDEDNGNEEVEEDDEEEEDGEAQSDAEEDEDEESEEEEPTEVPTKATMRMPQHTQQRPRGGSDDFRGGSSQQRGRSNGQRGGGGFDRNGRGGREMSRGGDRDFGGRGRGRGGDRGGRGMSGRGNRDSGGRGRGGRGGGRGGDRGFGGGARGGSRGRGRGGGGGDFKRSGGSMGQPPKRARRF